MMVGCLVVIHDPSVVLVDSAQKGGARVGHCATESYDGADGTPIQRVLVPGGGRTMDCNFRLPHATRSR